MYVPVIGGMISQNGGKTNICPSQSPDPFYSLIESSSMVVECCARDLGLSKSKLRNKVIHKYHLVGPV